MPCLQQSPRLSFSAATYSRTPRLVEVSSKLALQCLATNLATGLRSYRRLRAGGTRKYKVDAYEGPRKRDWRHWFEDAVQKAQLSNFRWHDLRHTFASRLVLAGVTLRGVHL